MRLRSSRFSPRLLGPEGLEQLTAGRELLMSQLVTNLVDSISSGQGRFDLLVGPRGIGKSHTLGVVEGRLRAHPGLREQLVVVSMPEEFYPSSLLHLLARVLEGLPMDESLPPVKAQLALLRGKPKQEAEQSAVAMIRGRLGQRSLLLMLENLDAIFKNLRKEAQARLRKILQTERTWSIFATARTAIALGKQSEPFHGTFVVKQLEPLSPVHSREMMVKLAQRHAQPKLEAWLKSDAGLARARRVHRLIGGSPRVISMIFHHLDPEALDDLEANFYGLAEELTPYFQEQMTRLSPGQRPVMEFLAERWSPASVREIADGTFSEPSSISTHLRTLRSDRMVRSMAVGKERFYEIVEPLHRIARAMKRDEKLAEAIANIARVLALMDHSSSHPTLPQLWFDEAGKGTTEEETDFEIQVVERLNQAFEGDDCAEVARLVEMLLSHASTLKGLSAAVLGCLFLDRGADAVAMVTALRDRGNARELGATYLLVIEAFTDGKCPDAVAMLRSEFEAHGDDLGPMVAGMFSVIGRSPVRCLSLLTGLIDGHGPKFAADFFVLKYPQHLTPVLWATLFITFWMRREFACVCAALDRGSHAGRSLGHQLESSLGALSDLLGGGDGGDKADKMWQTLAWCCFSIDSLDPQASHVTEDLAPASSWGSAALQGMSTIMSALWIGSGREVRALREIYRTHEIEYPSDLEDALSASDNAHAFARLGGETREGARGFLELTGSHEALARLPAEPT